MEYVDKENINNNYFLISHGIIQYHLSRGATDVRDDTNVRSGHDLKSCMPQPSNALRKILLDLPISTFNLNRVRAEHYAH